MNVSTFFIRIHFFPSPVHDAAFSLCVFGGSLEGRVRHISRGSLMGVRPHCVQAQKSHKDRAELPKICILREKAMLLWANLE